MAVDQIKVQGIAKVVVAEVNDKTATMARQDKKITSFQPAWLIRCSTPH